MTVLPAVCTVISITRKNRDTIEIIEYVVIYEQGEGDAPAIGIVHQMESNTEQT